MTRLAIGLVTTLVFLGYGATAQAQPPAGGAEPTPAPDTTPAPVEPGDPGAAPPPGDAAAAAPRRQSWEDIVVVPRKAFLKGGRLELAPFTGITINDVLIRHYAFGGNLNFYLTDVFSIGLEGQYFVKERSARERLVGLQYNRIPTLNRYKYAASFNFGYVPGYGKFTLFNKYIWHWDIFVTAGVGALWSEIIPRDPKTEAFETINLAPSFSVGTRFFISNWLTISFAFRDYVFNDKFEPTNRDAADPIDEVKKNATSQLVNNIMFTTSLGFYLPTSFTYRTPR